MNPNYTARVKHPYAQSVEGLFTLSAMLLLQSVSFPLNVYKSPSLSVHIVVAFDTAALMILVIASSSE